MFISKGVLIGFISFLLVGGGVGVVSLSDTQAFVFFSKAFPQASFWKSLFVKNVCGKRDPGARFVTSKDGKEVCDRTTGDIWERDLGRGEIDQVGAIEFCANLDKGHGKKYKLPSAQQLVSVLDYSQDNPALTPGVFSNPQSAAYWSDTLYSPDTSNGWAIELDNGDLKFLGSASNTAFVWCVRAEKAGHGDW